MKGKLSRRHQQTWQALYAHPTPSGIRWSEIVSLVKALGGEVEERQGSRMAFILGAEVAVLHKPHPKPTIGKADVRSVRRFLEQAGLPPGR